MATQELEQGICHRFGWSAHFELSEGGVWVVTVMVGLYERRLFVSDDASPDTKLGAKQGKRAAAELALAGLQDAVQRELDKPEKSLKDAVHHLFDGTFITTSWDQFWKNPPTVVGIDIEGNLNSPPVLVQIATEKYVILEAPRQELSHNLQRLIADDGITKVFCDGTSRDKKSLGIENPVDMTIGPVVDIEAVATKHMGPVKVARGLARILASVMPELHFRVQKQTNSVKIKDIGRFAKIEQGHAEPLQGIRDLTDEEQHHAAVDAWCTLLAWKQLQNARP